MILKDNKTKKEALAQYKEREIVGGVYAIRNTISGKMLVEATADLQGSKNRFAFSQQTGSCVYLKLQSDWNRPGGGGQFAFEALEELKKGEAQTAAEFKADVDALKEMWLEKLAGGDFY
jgi:hypothetical protein